MVFDRRLVLAAGLGAGAAAFSAAASAGNRKSTNSLPKSALPAKKQGSQTGLGLNRAALRDLEPNLVEEQTQALQLAIDNATSAGTPVVLPPGRFRIGHLKLRPNTRLIGAGRTTILEFIGGRGFVTAEAAAGLVIEGLVLDGGSLALDPKAATGLVNLNGCNGLVISNVEVRRGLMNAVTLLACSGRITDSFFDTVSQAAIQSIDGKGLDILHNTITDCGNAGIQIWRDTPGEDGSMISGNRIERIAAKGGGSGENGNGINVFRAGNVMVSGNRIADCAYTAVRANSAPNVQIIANNCQRLGEVALYAEFAFEGAVIANNAVDGAASGIEVTNFNEGGRLAVVQGNLVRNLFRRESEPEDKRGDGIGVEADAVVSGNVIEGAPNAGIVVGWGKYMRDVTVTQNLVRRARYGILVSSDPAAGACLITQNMISGAKDGAIRIADHGVPQGPDLAREAPKSARLAISGNVAV